jgi:hypothetical protein
MSKPVVVDDGGSVRIREMEDGVRMDGLLDPPGAPVVSNQNFTDLTGAFQCTLTVRYFDEEGVLTVLPLAGTKYGLVLAQNDIITITSSKGKQTVQITFDGNGFLNLLLSVGAHGAQEEKRRRYTVVNSGTINTVTSRITGLIFDGSNITRGFTMVHFSPHQPTTKISAARKHS